MCEKNVSDKMHKIKKYEGKMQKNKTCKIVILEW